MNDRKQEFGRACRVGVTLILAGLGVSGAVRGQQPSATPGFRQGVGCEVSTFRVTGASPEGCAVRSVRSMSLGDAEYLTASWGASRQMLLTPKPELAGTAGSPKAEEAAARGAAYLGGGAADYAKALPWLLSAAKEGNAEAATQLGMMYLEGAGVARDYAEAKKRFEAGAAAGNGQAMVNLGYLADAGLGEERDARKAAEWYARAAKLGDAMGENNLGDLYLRGIGVTQSDTEAFALFQKAASRGNTGASIKLGYMYLTGRGTPRNLQLAYAWMEAARLSGDARGEAYLAALRAKLTPAERAEAEQKAAQLEARRQ